MPAIEAPTTTDQQFNLTPHPRILAMLGEIVLPHCKCLAECIDNTLDSFRNDQRLGQPITNPHISITTPTAAVANPKILVRDNGPGMDVATLEQAARAGWTSHDPINNLGLFGMGFNIATARLGLRTTIWTTLTGQSEWVGLEIDFEQPHRRQAFLTPAPPRPQ